MVGWGEVLGGGSAVCAVYVERTGKWTIELSS